MKKIILLSALLSASIAINTHAETATETPATAAPVSTVTPTATNNAKPVTESKPAAKKSDDSQSVYDSVKSGWNSFIDTLAGPPTKK